MWKKRERLKNFSTFIILNIFFHVIKTFKLWNWYSELKQTHFLKLLYTFALFSAFVKSKTVPFFSLKSYCTKRSQTLTKDILYEQQVSRVCQGSDFSLLIWNLFCLQHKMHKNCVHWMSILIYVIQMQVM